MVRILALSHVVSDPKKSFHDIWTIKIDNLAGKTAVILRKERDASLLRAVVFALARIELDAEALMTTEMLF